MKEMIKILTDGHCRRDDYMKKFDQVKENIGKEVLTSLKGEDEVDHAKKWRRQRLQVRFFETGKFTSQFLEASSPSKHLHF